MYFNLGLRKTDVDKVHFSLLAVYSVPSDGGISSGMATDTLSSVISTLSSKVSFFCTLGTYKGNNIKCRLF